MPSHTAPDCSQLRLPSRATSGASAPSLQAPVVEPASRPQANRRHWRVQSISYWWWVVNSVDSLEWPEIYMCVLAGYDSLANAERPRLPDDVVDPTVRAASSLTIVPIPESTSVESLQNQSQNHTKRVPSDQLGTPSTVVDSSSRSATLPVQPSLSASGSAQPGSNRPSPTPPPTFPCPRPTAEQERRAQLRKMHKRNETRYSIAISLGGRKDTSSRTPLPGEDVWASPEMGDEQDGSGGCTCSCIVPGACCNGGCCSSCVVM